VSPRIDPFDARIVGDGRPIAAMDMDLNVHENLHAGRIGQTLVGVEDLRCCSWR